jgi:hypothetical protein
MQAFLLFSHQLFADAAKQPRTSTMVLIEDARLFQTGGNPSLAIFHRASLQAVRERLLVKGFAVRYMGADEYPTLEAAFSALMHDHPEVVRFYEVGDANLQKQLESLLKKSGTPYLIQPVPTPRIKVATQRSFIPKVLPPVEPNRYVEEAALYYGQLTQETQEIEFAYPVTRGDAEEWIEFVPELVIKGKNLKELASDLAPLLRNGLLDLAVIEAGVPADYWPSFRTFLTE